jgi:tRNA-Thr(GGU) m(6)t(6)A37 methyltransferase TsaA
MSVIFNPIGKVKIENNRYFVELDEKFFDASLGIDAFSHVLVLWWFSLYDSPESRNYLVLDKPYKKGPEKIGVLATRSPIRPNPIAVTACALIGLDKERRRLELSWIDAENDTPVLDIKPYEPSEDKVRDVVMPSWCAHWPQCLEESADFDWGSEFNF